MRKGQVKDLTGKTFSRLTALELSFIHPVQGAHWLCSCSCGASVVVAGHNLSVGNSRSCGCLALDLTRQRSTKHGWARSGAKRSAEYEIWSQLIQRCRNPKNKHFCNYGGRGIDVCDRRLVFEHFLEDMGPRPTSMHSIDRRNNDQGYSEGNCHWVTDDIQARNTRRNRKIKTPAGELLLCDAAVLSGLSPQVLWKRIRREWPADRLFDPLGTYVFSRQTPRQSSQPNESDQ